MATTVPGRKTGYRPDTFNYRPWLALGLIAAGIIILLLLSRQNERLDSFADSWNLGLRDLLNSFKRWVVVNRNSHWLFIFIFEPFSAVVDFALRRVEDFLLWLPWPVVLLAFFFLGERIGGLRLGLLTVACLLPMGLFGLWAESMQTLALMLMAVLVATLLGIPLGIWAARSRRGEQLLRPLLDGMQTLPALVYLIPVLLFFGVARVPSLIATVIYALPPIIRLTSLGIRQVPGEIIEAADAFGSTEQQLLRKVQLPLALPAITLGLNQTIMMALSIVVIAALIGAGGLGDVVLKALRRLQVGQALEAGLAIVLLAVLLDRLSAALSRLERHSRPRFQGFRLFSEEQRGRAGVARIEVAIERGYAWARRYRGWLGQGLARVAGRHKAWLERSLDWLAILLTLAVLALVLWLLGLDNFPRWLRLEINRPVDAIVRWMQVNLYEIGDSGFGTGPLRDFLILNVFQPLQHFLAETLPWTVVAFVFVAAAGLAGGLRLGLAVLVLIILPGLLGMWPFTMDTLAQTIVAVLICTVFGLPLGIWAAHNDRVDRLLRPLLDFLQTIPIFVYLVPVIMLFGTGSVAGLIASILYAAVPVIRLTNAGIRGVDPTLLESTAAFGSTPWQALTKVEIPLAFPTIMLGINQTIMMVLAMVIIAGLVGATGLGLEVYQGFANDNLGRSVEAGLAIVVMAVIIDRITQQWAQRAATAAHINIS